MFVHPEQNFLDAIADAMWDGGEMCYGTVESVIDVLAARFGAFDERRFLLIQAYGLVDGLEKLTDERN